MQYRAEVDGLRAVAVMPVIFFHAGASQMPGGFVGVDIFFVISGFLITDILMRELRAGKFSLLGFYERRARRILPALFLVLFASFVAGAFIMLPYEFATFGRHIVAVVFFVSNIVFSWENGYFAPAAELNPLLHTWSLAVEEQYYILFPPFLWACWRWFRRGLVPLLILIAVGSLVLAEYLSIRSPSANFYLLPTRAWEILAGSLAAVYLMDRPVLRGWLAEIVGLAGLGAILVSIVAYDAYMPFPSAWALVPVLGAVAVILAASPATLAGKILGSRPFVGIGLISYSAYLWHQPLLAFARLLDADKHYAAEVKLALIGVTLVLAWLTWRFVEQPFRRRDAFGRKSIFALSGLGGAALSGIGAIAVVSGGLPQRYPEHIRPLVSTTLLDYSAYVNEAHTRMKGVSLADDRPNLVLVGDSYSWDLSNMIDENDGFAGFAISTIYVPTGCQFLYGPPFGEIADGVDPLRREECASSVLTDEKLDTMRRADIVIFAPAWHDWSARLFVDSLPAMNLGDDTRVFAVGSKNFQDNRLSAVAAFEKEGVAAVYPVSDRISRTNAILEKGLGKDVFISLTEAFCEDGACPVFTPQGDLISYDGGHLTAAGAAYLGGRLFSSTPLERFSDDAPVSPDRDG